jgi:ribosomal protein S20
MIRKAKKSLRTMSKTRQIDLMVKAGVMTQKQATRAKKKLAEVQG